MERQVLIDAEHPENLVLSLLEEIRRPLAAYIEAAVAAWADPTDWTDWRNKSSGNAGAISQVDRSLKALTDHNLWTRHFSMDLAETMVGAPHTGCPSPEQVKAGLARVKVLRALRNRRSHKNDDEGAITDAEALVAIDYASRLMVAVGAPEVIPRLHQLRGVASAREHRRARRRYPSSGLRVDRVEKGTMCVGAHWSDPRPDTGLPSGWWLAVVRDGALLRIDGGVATRDLCDYLQGAPLAAPAARAGLAFCFSTPAWYLHSHHGGNPRHAWDFFADHGDEEATPALLAEIAGPPFHTTESGPPPYKGNQSGRRRCEEQVEERTGARPSSVFELGGRATVGALAILGAPVLATLQDAGYAIWPFDRTAKASAIAVEIFPRSLWAALNPDRDPVSSEEDRRAFLEIPEVRAMVDDGASRERLRTERRAFDAFLTAFALSRYGRRLPAREGDTVAAVEGEIWLPREA